MITATLEAPGQAKVLVFHEHGATRLGLALVLSRETWVERCLTVETLKQATAVVRAQRPDVVVLELSTFVAPHVDALREVDPDIRIVLCSHCAHRTKVTATRLGAAGVLDPKMSSSDVAKIVQAAALGGAPAAPHAHPHADELGLTDRELRVMAFLTMGATNREIADELHLSRESIKKHAMAIYRKLGVRNRTELARVAAQRAHARA